MTSPQPGARRANRLIYLAIAVAMVVVFALGAVLLLRKPSAPPADASNAADRAAAPAPRAETGQPGLAGLAARDRARAAARRQLWYVDAYEEIERKAKAGDAFAQRRLSELYGDCLAFAGPMATNVSIMRQVTSNDPLARPRVDKIISEFLRLCQPAVRAATSEAYRYWLRESAKRGDLVAQMRLHMVENKTVDTEVLQGFLSRVRNEGDAQALYEFSRLVSRYKGEWPDPGALPALRGPLVEHAWVLAACRAGLECGKGSKIMEVPCLTVYNCDQPDYRSFLIDSGLLDPVGLARADAVVGLINSRLLVPPDRVPQATVRPAPGAAAAPTR